MREFALVTAVRESDARSLDALCKSIQQEAMDGDGLIACFDGCSEDFVDDAWKEYSFIDIIHHKGNPEGVPASINKCLRYVHKTLKKDAMVFFAHKEGPYANSIGQYTDLAFFPLPDFNAYFCKISLDNMERIGYLDTIFKDQLFLLDYAFRAKLAGEEITLSEDILEQELKQKTNEFDVIKFGTKWGFAPEVVQEDFWTYMNSKKYVWVEGMRVG
jgi:hypothetical protein